MKKHTFLYTFSRDMSICRILRLLISSRICIFVMENHDKRDKKKRAQVLYS